MRVVDSEEEDLVEAAKEEVVEKEEVAMAAGDSAGDSEAVIAPCS